MAVLEAAQNSTAGTGADARLLKLANEVPSKTAWALASRNRRSLRLALETNTRSGAAMHDRRLPRSGSKLDHVVVGAHGVFVVAVRLHVGTLSRSTLVEGRGTLLRVGGGDATNLVADVARQAHGLRSILASAGLSDHVAVQPVLCLPSANWPLLARPFRIDEVLVASGARMGRLVRRRGNLRTRDVDHVSSFLRSELPPTRHHC